MIVSPLTSPGFAAPIARRAAELQTAPPDGYAGAVEGAPAAPPRPGPKRTTVALFRDGQKVRQEYLGRDGRLVWLGERFLVVGEESLRGLDRQGNTLFELPRSPDFKHATFDEHSGKLLILEKQRALALDPGTGRELHRLDLPFEGGHLDATSNGVVIRGQNTVLVAGSDLDNPRTVQPRSPMITPVASLMADGTLVLKDRGLEVISPENEVVYQYQGSGYKSALQEPGRLTFIDDPYGEPRLTTVDTRTGAVKAFPVSRDAQDLLPRPDGTVLVREHHDYTRSTFRLYSAGGEQLKKFTVKGSVENVRLSRDGSQAYVAVRQWHDKPERNQLFRLDLEDEPEPLWQRGLGLLTASIGLGEGKTELYSEPGERKMFHFAPLQDGRLAVVSEGGAFALDADGRPGALSLDSPLLENPDLMAYHRATNLEGYLRGFQGHNQLAELKTHLWERGGVISGGCAQFPQAAGAGQALAEAGLQDVDSHALSSRVLLDDRTERTAVFPDLTGARVNWDRDTLNIELPAGRPGEFHRTTFWKDDGSDFTAVLPLRVGADYLVAAGSDNGHVYLVEPDKATPGYDLGSPVVKLVLSPEGRIVAFGKDGAMMVLDLGREIKAGDGMLPSHEEAKRVIVSEAEVTIGDISLDVTQW